MLRKITTIAVLAVVMGLTTTGTALAGGSDSTGVGLPAPGILGLIAFGVIGAIALAKSRK